MVAAIVAGDPDGIAQAYDTYAMPLYSYCRSLLREPEDAADAVQDTFLIAMAKLGSLRDPGKLRSWLFAVARNECYRRLRSGEATSGLDETLDLPATAGGKQECGRYGARGARDPRSRSRLGKDGIHASSPVGESFLVRCRFV